MLLTGRWIDAQEAYHSQLVNRIVPREELLDTAKAMAVKIASHDPVAVRYAKRALVRGLELPLNEGLYLEKLLASRLKPKADPGKNSKAME
jgi:enoyl-CoA hydratase/carnithine racemase